jgi:hypothetical protein
VSSSPCPRIVAQRSSPGVTTPRTPKRLRDGRRVAGCSSRAESTRTPCTHERRSLAQLSVPLQHAVTLPLGGAPSVTTTHECDPCIHRGRPPCRV